MDFYLVSEKYVNYLRQFEPRVEENKNETRPYVGVVLEIDGTSFYVPLKSPKPKHQHMRNSIDFKKIKDGKLGAINFNNMIPVPDSEINRLVIKNVEDAKYRLLLQRQYREISMNLKSITKDVGKLYHIQTSDESTLSKAELLIKKRCCNLPLLMEKMKEFQT